MYCLITEPIPTSAWDHNISPAESPLSSERNTELQQHIPLAKYILIDKANCPKISNVGDSFEVPLLSWTHLYRADNIYRFRQSLVRRVTKKASTVTYPQSIGEKT
jgi:hypothetical protein